MEVGISHFLLNLAANQGTFENADIPKFHLIFKNSEFLVK